MPKSYDDSQRDAPLLTCRVCGKQWYVTKPFGWHTCSRCHWQVFR